jgi:hypothetical protein
MCPQYPSSMLATHDSNPGAGAGAPATWRFGTKTNTERKTGEEIDRRRLRLGAPRSNFLVCSLWTRL